MINPESIKDIDYFRIEDLNKIEGAIYYARAYPRRSLVSDYNNRGVQYRMEIKADQIEYNEFLFLLNLEPSKEEPVELFIAALNCVFQVSRYYDYIDYKYIAKLEKQQLINMEYFKEKIKGTFTLTLEEAREYWEKGGIHREIALKTGYTIEELTTTEDEWKDKFVGKSITGYYMTSVSEIFKQTTNGSWSDRSTFRTEQQAKSALAYAQLTQLMALPEYNGTWEPNWSGFKQFKCSIVRLEDEARIIKLPRYYSELTFSSEERCSDFLRKNKMLVNEFLQITKK